MRKKTKKRPFMDFYKLYMEYGVIPRNGLCNCFGTCFTDTDIRIDEQYAVFKLFLPENRLESDSRKLPGGPGGTNYWGHERHHHRDFGPLRQTIVLLCAAINNEI